MTPGEPSTPSMAETTAVPPPVPSKWDERIRKFATAVGKPADTITKVLVDLVGNPGDEAVLILSDASSVTDEDLKKVLVDNDPPKIPLGVFRKNLTILRGPQTAAPAAATGTGGASALIGILPEVPNDASFTEMLKVGGVLRPGETEVMAATKAALAAAVGVYDLPEVIAEKMESYAETLDEPVGQQFFELRKMVTRRDYGEILAALGTDGNFATQTRRKSFLTKLNSNLWGAVSGFHNQLVAWQDAWNASMGSSGMLAMAAIAMGAGSRGALPPNVMAPPDTSGLRSAGEDVINTINRVFGGLGIPIARVLAADAMRIKQVLSDPNLPIMIGAPNREQMLKLLGVDITSDYVRLELNVTRYVLAIMKLPTIASGNDEVSYLIGMLQLGAAIPWEKLPGSQPETITRPNGDNMHRRPTGRSAIGIGSSRGMGDAE